MNTQLIKNVISQSGLNASDIQDITSHGAAGKALQGFTWYDDTVKFFDDNKALIIELAENDLSEIYDHGTTIFDMLTGFNSSDSLTILTVDMSEAADQVEDEDGDLFTDFDNLPHADSVDFGEETAHAVECFDTCTFKAIEVDTGYKNLMSWYALESVCQHLERFLEEHEEDCHEKEGFTNLEYIESLGIACDEWKEDNL